MNGISRTLRIAAVAVQGGILALSLYQSFITVAGRARASRPAKPREEDAGRPLPSIAAIICARNEEVAITDAVAGLLGQDYPAHLSRVAVMAHNCTDKTAELAREAGATVVEVLTEAPGKVHGLRAGLQLYGDHCDLIGVFDADTRVKPSLFHQIAAASAGEDCLQAETIPHDVHAVVASGYGLGRKARNLLWWQPRAALGLGSTINGTGFFIRPAVLAAMLGESHTLTEDLELTARLYASGRRVAYLPGVQVVVEEPEQFSSSMKQRLRWVRGHLGVVRFTWPALARRAATGDARAFDMAVYLLTPTRLITRVGVSGMAAATVLRAPFAFPVWVVGPSVALEWVLPFGVLVRERVVEPSLEGARTTLTHALLSLCWFPLGVAALFTARVKAWDLTPRAAAGDRDAVPTR
ncbi:MAG: glycosyltransferase [Chloroflexi bacterium]|nr:glycosyltransferase [Chloroflexota bacterium]